MPNKSNHQELRIIGGTHRGRKFTFPEDEAIRPTPNRVRETLFNWLASSIANATVLDLFTGSGALSLEALSRGAKEVVAVDCSKNIISHLKKIKQSWNLPGLTLVQKNIPAMLPIAKKSLDIVLLDPPFQHNLLPSICQWLEKTQWLSDDAIIYIEMEKKHADLELPLHWMVIKNKTAGDVSYLLVRRSNKSI